MVDGQPAHEVSGMRMTQVQREAMDDLATITASGHDYWRAVAFFQRRGITLAKHPKDGYAFVSFLSGVGNTCAMWRKVVGSVNELIDVLDAPSQVIRERDGEQPRVSARM